MSSLVLLQWDVLGSDYYWIQLQFYNFRLLLNKDQEIKVFQKYPLHKQKTDSIKQAIYPQYTCNHSVLMSNVFYLAYTKPTEFASTSCKINE